MSLGRKQTRRSEGGAVMLEYAMLIPFLLIITFSIIQLSLLYVADSVMEYAAFSAARAELVRDINVHESLENTDPQVAAAMICSLISFGEDPIEDRINIPGWGKLYGSAYSKNATSVTIEPSLDLNNTFTATVQFEYAMLFPQLAIPYLYPKNPEDDPDNPIDPDSGTLRLTKSYTMNRSFER